MMEELAFISALASMILHLLTLCGGALAIWLTFVIAKNLLERGHSDFEAGERCALEESNQDPAVR